MSRWPVVTLLLIAANIAAAFALLLHPDLSYEFGFHPNRPHASAAFTSLFLHANVLHLMGNMLFLAAVGAAVELATGSFRFTVVYFLSGLVGVVAHMVFARSAVDPVPYIGASGAIAGCAAYYTIRYTSLRVPVAPTVALPVLGVTALWVLLQIGGAFIQIGNAGEGVAYWSHLGGFAAGVLLTFVFRAPDMGQIKLGHEVLERMNSRGPAAVVVAAERHLEKHPNDLVALEELADAYSKLNEHAKEADVLMHMLEVASVDQQPDVVRRLSRIGHMSRIPVIRRLKMADRCRIDCPFVAKALLRSVVEGPEDVQRPDALFTLASLEREESEEKSRELLSQLESEYPLHATVDLARKRGWLTQSIAGEKFARS